MEPEENISPLRTLIVDDHPLLRASVRLVLEQDGGFVVVGEAGSENELFALLPQLEVDLVVLDLGLDSPSAGFRCLDRLRAWEPPLKTVIFSGLRDPELVREALHHGAAAYIVKSATGEDFAEKLRAAMDGKVYRPATGVPRRVHLTPREAEMLDALRRGLSNKEISRELWISQQTVKYHLANIYRKLGVSNRTQAASWAQRRGITPPAGNRLADG